MASDPASPKLGDISAQRSSRSDGKLDVFISYCSRDLHFADQLYAALDTYDGFECFLDRQDISGGEDWKRRLENLIKADAVVFVLTPDSARSETCAWELEEATRLGKRILPVNCRSLKGASSPRRLRDLNYIYFYEDPKTPGSGFGTGLAKLVADLNTEAVKNYQRSRGIEVDGIAGPQTRAALENAPSGVRRDAGLKAAIKAAGGVRPLARAIGVSHVAVLAWTSVPIRRLLKVEAVTGIPRKQLRPDVFLAPRADLVTVDKSGTVTKV
jgi:hypothetical protein